ncbi:MAG: adenosylcobinamide-phosphate synthase CbiB, partial [Mariprofundales bacterium]
MTLLLALALEWMIGDPDNRWHPVAWFGQWAARCEAQMYRNRRAHGGGAWLMVVGLPLLLIVMAHAMVGWPLDLLLVWLTIGWKSLFCHVRAVLDATTLQQARNEVGRIVSRDTAAMDFDEARRAALESLAENANDAVIAPLFWFVIAGAPGAVLYRMINTLDAMWGYHNPRYHHFGYWAAKIDDAANCIPARLTAVLLLLIGRIAGQSTPWHKVQRDAASHASPNAGWPEAALAWAAGVRLGGPVVRGGIVEPRPWYGDAHNQSATADIDTIAAN